MKLTSFANVDIQAVQRPRLQQLRGFASSSRTYRSHHGLHDDKLLRVSCNNMNICTSGSRLLFEICECSTVALMEPSESWVARWQRLDRFQPGIYAIQVSGRLPEDTVADLEARGISYQPRDGSSNV